MKGYVTNIREHTPDDDWLSVCAEAVGNVIAFWGFKRNHGRVWALLYLTDSALSALEIQERLGLSKGGVSMMTRELETWKVIRRVRRAGESAWRFEAEVDLIHMLSNVLSERESVFISRICADLERAGKMAENANVSEATLKRVHKLLGLGRAAEKALSVFMRTARLDLKSFIKVFGERKKARS